MRKKLFYIIAIIVVMVFIISSVFSIANKPQEVKAEGTYKVINEVDGIAFNVNTNIVNMATAISEISENIKIDPNLFYLYKDKDTYLLFNVNALVIAAQKGTTFHFDQYSDDDKAQAVTNSSVAGMWFTQNGSKFKYDNGKIFTANVNAGLVLTNAMYNDFVGQLGIITDGTTEWSIFVGVPGTNKYKDLPDATKKSISAIVNSITFSDYTPIPEEETYAVVINGEGGETGIIADAEMDVPEREVITMQQEPEEPDIEKTGTTETPDGPDTQKIAEVTEPVPDEATVEEGESSEAIPGAEEIPLEISEEAQQPGQYIEEALTPADLPEPSPGAAIFLNNQKKFSKKSANNAYTSDIYSFLSLKDNGIITEYDRDAKDTVKPVINIQRIYTGGTAVRMIQDYCSQATILYNYFDAPAGCSWHLAEYYLSYANCSSEPYIDIKLKGIDGSSLKYNGIKYSKRTYDIFADVHQEPEDVFKGPYFCYYAVPNGCPEYVLECGTGDMDIPNTGCKAAYYLVKTK